MPETQELDSRFVSLAGSVLLVEDNPGDAALIRRMLQIGVSAKVDVEIAENVHEAGLCLDSFPDRFRVVLLDLNLPDGRGADAYKALQDKLQSVPVIALTGVNDSSLASDLLQLGVQDYLVKDALNPDLLIRTIRYAAERKKLENQLCQEMEKADAANRAKSIFLANMSHEIRTPLNGVLGMLNLLRGTSLNQEQEHYASIAINSGQHLLALINQILTMSKVESQEIGRERCSFNLRECLESILDFEAFQSHQKDVSLYLKMDNDVPELLLGDVTHLRQIITNLVHNAIKFTEQGRVEILVSLESRDGERVRLAFQIRDTGAGIPAAHLESIFEPFSQTRPLAGEAYDGVGLGLSICRRLTELLDGTLSVESRVKHGTTFHLCLSFDAADGRRIAPPAALQGLNVWFVDPSQVAREQMRSLLEQCRCKVETEASLGMLMAKVSDPEARAILMLPETSYEDVREEVETGMFAGFPLIWTRRLGAAPRAVPQNHPPADQNHLMCPVKRKDLWQALLRASGEQPARTVSPAAPSMEHSWVRARARFRILLVEDNIVNQQVASHILKNHGYRHDLAADGHEAVTLCSQFRYDCILMDCIMPRLDGFEATRRILALDEAYSRVPVIGLSALAFEEEREAALKAGMVGFMTKPVDPDRLIAALDARLDVSAPEAEESEQPEKKTARPGSETSMYFLVSIDRLRKTTMDNPDFAQRIVAAYLRSTAEHIRNFNAALDRGDIDQARKIVHTLKGSSSQIGATRMFTLAQQWNDLLRNDDIQSVRDDRAQIDELFTKTRDALERYVSDRLPT